MSEQNKGRPRTLVRGPDSAQPPAVPDDITELSAAAPADDVTQLSQAGHDAQAAQTSHDSDATVPSEVSNDETIPSEIPPESQSPSAASIAPNQTTLIKRKSTEKSGRVQVGSIIRDRFVIEKMLGAGGMGAVYRAVDLRKHEAGDNDPYIAIKLLTGNFQHHSDAFVTLQREAKKTQALAHPNIVTVYDFDRDGDLIYLTMEELKGDSLSDLLKGRSQRTLNDALRISIVDQIAKGLSYAHSKGIVHSDLKPANVFITEKGEVKLLDFGIARAANEELYQDSFDAGKLGALTFAYASLEMIQFDPPHPSDDIYALGIIACELLDGVHPYERKDARQVLRLKLKPKKLKVKNPFLRKCLYRAIEIRRENRIPDAREFLKKFHWSRNAPRKFTVSALVLAFLIAAQTYYVSTIEPDPIEFNSLSVEQQAKFHQLIEQGNEALRFQDLQGAVVNFNEAYLIHQTHDDIRRAKKVVLHILDENLEKAKPENRDFVRQQIDSLRQYPAFADDTLKKAE